MAITVSWTNTVTRVNVHGIEQDYKVGVWLYDGEEKGVIEVPILRGAGQLITDEGIIQGLEQTWQMSNS